MKEWSDSFRFDKHKLILEIRKLRWNVYKSVNEVAREFYTYYDSAYVLLFVF